MIFRSRIGPLWFRLLIISAIICAYFALTIDTAGQTPAGTSTSSAQQGAKKPGEQQVDDVIRISTNLVQVDVIVTDGKGQHVTNLKPEDFIIEIDGKPQMISFFRPTRCRRLQPRLTSRSAAAFS